MDIDKSIKLADELQNKGKLRSGRIPLQRDIDKSSRIIAAFITIWELFVRTNND